MVSAGAESLLFCIIAQESQENNLVFPSPDKILFIFPGFPGKSLDEPEFPVYIADRLPPPEGCVQFQQEEPLR